MAKLRQDPKTGCFEWEGTPQELLSIYAELKQHIEKTVQIMDTIPHKFDPPIPIHTSLNTEYQQLSKKMPTVDQLMIYILSKPKFEHDIVDVGLKFFGKPIKSRKYGKLYRELRAKLENARKQIEVGQHGAFERKSTHPRNLQRYTFRSVSATPLGIQPEKTS